MFSYDCFPELDGREAPFIALLGVVQAAILVPFRGNSVHRSDRGGFPKNELDAEAKMPIAVPTLPLATSLKESGSKNRPRSHKGAYKRFSGTARSFFRHEHYSLGGISALLPLPFLISNSDGDPLYPTSRRAYAHEARQRGAKRSAYWQNS